MKTSQKGIDLIKSFEGLKHKPYLCPAGVPTIGYGTTVYPSGKHVTLNDRAITEAEAESLLRSDLEKFERSVEHLVTTAISQNQFDALVSFAYNLGANSLAQSTLLKKVNKMPFDPSIQAEFLKWCNANGKPLAGLKRRRQAESDLYFKL